MFLNISSFYLGWLWTKIHKAKILGAANNGYFKSTKFDEIHFSLVVLNFVCYHLGKKFEIYISFSLFQNFYFLINNIY